MPFPTPGDIPDPVTESVCLVSPALARRFFTTGPPGKPTCNTNHNNNVNNNNNNSVLAFLSSACVPGRVERTLQTQFTNKTLTLIPQVWDFGLIDETGV